MNDITQFEMPVEDIISTAEGTVFCGTIQSGSISKYDSVVCRTQGKEITIRVSDIREAGTTRELQTANAGSYVGVLGQKIKLDEFGPKGTVRLASVVANTRVKGESASSSPRGFIVSILVAELIGLLYFLFQAR